MKTFGSFISGVLVLLAGVAQAGEAPTSASWWLAKPDQTEPRILAWAERFPDLVTLEKQRTFHGRTVYALTVTNPKLPIERKQRLLFSQPHAHEPAGTAAMMNVICQLLEGKHLDGRDTDLDRTALLDRALLTFIADGNPEGRSRAPCDWWDGNKLPNEEFFKVMFGKNADGSRFQRVDRWSTRDFQPAFIGIAYEPINEHEYAEPNRCVESSFFKLVNRCSQRYDYGYHVDLHQTEFERSKFDTMMIIPCLQKELPEAIRDGNQALAEAIVGAWRGLGANPQPKIEPLNYGEEQLNYFRRCWGEIYRRRVQVSTEVQNNNTRTPPKRQMELQEAAIRTTIRFALDRVKNP